MKKNSIMKNEWEISDFENCLEKVNYTKKIQKKDFKEQGNFPIISQEQEFVNGYWDEEKDLFRIVKPVVIFGDHTKVIKYVDFDFVLGADGVKILKTKKHIVPKYLYYYLQNIELENLGYARHYRLLKEKMIEYPKSLPEQHRIVSILDKCFSAIDKAKANAEQNLKNAKELFESYLQEKMSEPGFSGLKDEQDNHKEKILKSKKTLTHDSDKWEVKKLGECIVKTDTIDPTKNPDKEFTYLDVSSVNKETKKIENPVLLLGKDAPSRARKIIKTRDVIFATVRPTHSRVTLIPLELNDQVCSTGYFVVRPKNFLNSEFVFYFFLTDGFNKRMEKLQKGANYPAVTDIDIKETMITFPKSLPEQQRIVRQLDALRSETKKLEAIYQKKIANLDELKKTILQKAFNCQNQDFQDF